MKPLEGGGKVKRYFEFTGADADRGTSNSSKFWEVDVDGQTVTVRFGKIGASGQTTVKDLGSPTEAAAQVLNPSGVDAMLSALGGAES